jgi:hypothetical protein
MMRVGSTELLSTPHRNKIKNESEIGT